jgi:hypothetical protein
VQATLLYTQTARPLKNRHAWALADEAKADGVVRRIKKVPLHGKFVTWDDDDLVVTSSDWASASADPDFAWGEIGVHIHAMRVFVSGATGVLGRQLLPKLVAAGQSVWGMTRYSAKADLIGAAGATPVIADALDRDAVIPAIANAAPEVIVHELTALSSFANLRRFDQELAPTNRLRTKGTRYLLDGARKAGARRFVAQSFAGWPFAREGGPVKTEENPLDPNPPIPARQTLAAI